MNHGSRGTYTNRKCRCRKCKKANSDYFRRRRTKAKRAAKKVVA